MNRTNKFILDFGFFLLFTLTICTLRIGGEKGIFFQAIAHLYVAWLFAGAYYTKNQWFLFLAIVMSVVETICFFVI